MNHTFWRVVVAVHDVEAHDAQQPSILALTEYHWTTKIPTTAISDDIREQLRVIAQTAERAILSLINAQIHTT